MVKRIWLVDDDEEMTRAMKLMLKMLNCEITSFLNARGAAQALLTNNLPDLLILDINMPEVTGLDLLEFLRRKPEWKHLPVLMLSTEATDVTIDRAMELGANGYISKPVTIDELEKAMNAVLRNVRKVS